MKAKVIIADEEGNIFPSEDETKMCKKCFSTNTLRDFCINCGEKL